MISFRLKILFFITAFCLNGNIKAGDLNIVLGEANIKIFPKYA